MKKKILSLALFAALSISVAFAQDNITGHWTGKLMDQYNITYDFKADGNSLTGKDTHYDGSVDNISNGKIYGDTLSFDVPIQGETTHLTGKLKNGVLTLYFSIQGNDLSVDLKKTESK